MKKILRLLGLIFAVTASAVSANPKKTFIQKYNLPSIEVKNKESKVKLPLSKGAFAVRPDSADVYDLSVSPAVLDSRVHYTFDASNRLLRATTSGVINGSLIPVMRLNQTFNTAGKQTSLLFETNDQGTWIGEGRVTWRYNSSGDNTSLKSESYDQTTSTWSIDFADSLAYTYSGTPAKISRATWLMYDDSSATYKTQFRFDSIVYNAANEPTSLVLSVPIGGPLFLPYLKLTNVSWGFGYPGLAGLLHQGIDFNIASEYFGEYEAAIDMQPTNATQSEYAIPGGWKLASRTVEVKTAGKVTSIQNDDRDQTTNTWVPNDKTLYAWATNGKLAKKTYQMHDGAMFVNDSRTTYTYDVQNWVSDELSEIWDDVLNAWDLNQDDLYSRTFMGNGDIKSIVTGSDFGSGMFLNDSTVFRRGSVGFDDLIAKNTNIYPNPVSDVLTIQAPNIAIQAINVFDLTGRLVSTYSYKNNGNSTIVLPFNTLANGVYNVQIQTSEGITVKKVIKN